MAGPIAAREVLRVVPHPASDSCARSVALIEHAQLVAVDGGRVALRRSAVEGVLAGHHVAHGAVGEHASGERGGSGEVERHAAGGLSARGSGLRAVGSVDDGGRRLAGGDGHGQRASVVAAGLVDGERGVGGATAATADGAVIHAVHIVAVVHKGQVGGLTLAVVAEDEARGHRRRRAAVVGPLEDFACAVGSLTHEFGILAGPIAAREVLRVVPHPAGYSAARGTALVEHTHLVILDGGRVHFQVVHAGAAATATTGDVLGVGVAVLLVAVIGQLGGIDAAVAIEVGSILAHLARAVEHVDAHVALAAERRRGERAVVHSHRSAGDALGVGAVEHIAEGGAGVEGDEGITVDAASRVAALEGIAAIARAVALGVLTLAQCGHCGADEVQTLQVLHQGSAQRSSHVAACAAHLGKVAHRDVAGEVTAVVGATGALEVAIGALVHHHTLAELNLAALEQAGDAAHGEQQTHVLGPLVGAAVEAVETVGTVVVALHIVHVERGVVI